MLSRRLLFLSCTLLASCARVGPSTVELDQIDYGTSMYEAAKREMLLNIVRLRYAELPTLVSINQIIAGYEATAKATIGTQFFRQGFNFDDDFAIGAEGTFATRPTVTYTPLRGEDYARAMLRPLPPEDIFALLIAGANARTLFGLAVQRLNGIKNAMATVDDADSKTGTFTQVVDLLAGLRDTALIQFDIREQNGVREIHIQFTDDPALDPEGRVGTLRRLLDLDPSMRSYRLAFGVRQKSANEIAVLTRPLIGILTDVAEKIDVPEAHIEEGRTMPMMNAKLFAPSIVKIGVHDRIVPDFDAHVRVRYQNHFFWIANDDLPSKRVFAMIMLLGTLAADTDNQDGATVMIPAN